MKVYNEQAYRVTVLGEMEARQDSCAFSRRALNNTAPFIREGRKKWCVVSTQPDDGVRDAYYGGSTRFPSRCELESPIRQTLLEDRVESKHGGTACYDCPRRCAAYEAPPRLKRVGAFPEVVDDKPREGGIEAYPLTVWVEPNPEHWYALGADCAKGVVGGDYNCFVVIDVTTGEQVAAFREQCSQTIYPAVIAAVWSYYGNWAPGSMVIESNNMGMGVIMDMMLAYKVPTEVVFHRQDRRKRHMLSGQPLTEPGFATTRGSKYGSGSTLETPHGSVEPPIMALQHMLESRDLILHDPVLFGEMQTFIRQEGFLGGMDGTHDDTVIAAMLAAFATQVSSRTLRPIKTREVVRDFTYHPELDDEAQEATRRVVDGRSMAFADEHDALSQSRWREDMNDSATAYD